MAKSFWQRGEDYAQKVSSEIIDQIKAGVAPWQKPWKPGEQISAENFSTGNKYSGGNSLYLMSRAIRDGRGDNRWGTYNQIREAGGQVRKGEKGTQVLFFTDRNSRVAKDEKGQTLTALDRRNTPAKNCGPTGGWPWNPRRPLSAHCLQLLCVRRHLICEQERNRAIVGTTGQ